MFFKTTAMDTRCRMQESEVKLEIYLDSCSFTICMIVKLHDMGVGKNETHIIY